jgi:hypothetical protein
MYARSNPQLAGCSDAGALDDSCRPVPEAPRPPSFRAHAEGEAFADFISMCQGVVTVSEVKERLASAAEIGPEAYAEEYAEALCALLPYRIKVALHC